MASFLNDPNRDRSLPDTCPHLPSPPLLCPGAALRHSTASLMPLSVAMAMSTTTSDPLLLLPLIGGKTGQHFVGFITSHRSQLSLVGNLPLSPFPFPFSLSWWCRKGRKERERRKGKGKKGRLPTGERCEWRPVMTPAKGQSVSLGRKGEADGGYGRKNKKDNFGKSLNPRVISAQNMQSTQSTWKIYNFPH